MDGQPVVRKITDGFRKILGENLTGLYLHGSIAFGCFSWDRSDIDLIAVVQTPPSLEEKIRLIQFILDLEEILPPKGLEMSVVLEKDCRKFSYPTFFVLHYSKAHRERCKRDLRQFCLSMHGTDWDLAAHFTVIRAVGICLWGKKIDEVFGPVPKSDFLDSLRRDLAESAEKNIDSPVSLILNYCRTLAFLQQGLIISKEQGGRWGINHLPDAFRPLIQAAWEDYQIGKPFSGGREEVQNFLAKMEKQINYLMGR